MIVMCSSFLTKKKRAVFRSDHFSLVCKSVECYKDHAFHRESLREEKCSSLVLDKNPRHDVIVGVLRQYGYGTSKTSSDSCHVGPQGDHERYPGPLSVHHTCHRAPVPLL